MKKKIAVILFLLVSVFSVLPAAALGNTAFEYYYAQLNGDEKSMYASFAQAIEAGQQEFEITGILQDYSHFVLYKKGLTNSNAIKTVVSQSNELQAIMQKIDTSFQTVMDALFLDHPEYFWLDGKNCTIKIGFSTENYSPADGKIEVSLSFTGNWTVKSGYSGYENLYAQVMRKIEAIGTGEDRFGTLKKIHDFLCCTIVYDKAASRCGDAVGALVDGKAVCQGYAHAFKIACDFYSIPCVCVTGTGIGNNGAEAHMWNYVQMEDGAWYAVDCTWDDGTEKIYYDYFLSGASTVDTYFGKHRFTDTHAANGRQTAQSTKFFSYPLLAEAAYSYEMNKTTPAVTPVPSNGGITPENPSIAATPEIHKTPPLVLSTPNSVLNTNNNGAVVTEPASTPTENFAADEEKIFTEDKEKRNHGWVIAAGVVLFAVAVFGAGIFIIIKRKKNKKNG